jgi:hypothetical protein
VVYPLARKQIWGESWEKIPQDLNYFTFQMLGNEAVQADRHSLIRFFQVLSLFHTRIMTAKGVLDFRRTVKVAGCQRAGCIRNNTSVGAGAGAAGQFTRRSNHNQKIVQPAADDTSVWFDPVRGIGQFNLLGNSSSIWI